MKSFALLTGLLFAAGVATSALANPAPAAASKGDPAKAQKLVNDVCGACHGTSADFSVTRIHAR